MTEETSAAQSWSEEAPDRDNHLGIYAVPGSNGFTEIIGTPDPTGWTHYNIDAPSSNTLLINDGIFPTFQDKKIVFQDGFGVLGPSGYPIPLVAGEEYKLVFKFKWTGNEPAPADIEITFTFDHHDGFSFTGTESEVVIIPSASLNVEQTVTLIGTAEGFDGTADTPFDRITIEKTAFDGNNYETTLLFNEVSLTPNTPQSSWSEENSSSGSMTEETSSAGSWSEENSAAGSMTEETSSSGSWSEETSSTGSMTEETSSAGSMTEETSSTGSWSEETSSGGSWTEETS
jgi:hypothetical protein